MEAAAREEAAAQIPEIAQVEPGEPGTACVGDVNAEETLTLQLISEVPQDLELAPIAVETGTPVCESPISEASASDPVTEESFVCEPSVHEPLVAEPLVAEHLDAIVVDKGLGFPGVMDLLKRLTANSHPAPVVVWGAVVTEAEALKLLQAGAKGILRRTSESGTLLTCLRAVTAGGTWMEDGIFGSAEKLYNPKRSQLTNRESQVVVLVEKGLRNRDIACMLGIQTGTVKIHLKHIFEKTGVRGRYGLAFTGLQSKGSITMSSPSHLTA
jgi:DNA-binding NarL/FixJ family response regulator